jgi:uncharacterized membrane protein YcaP (DUF421 family)
VVLIGFNAGLDRFAESNPTLRRLLIGHGTDLIVDGKVDRGALSRLGLSEGELNLALRRQGADDVVEVERAALEPEGEIVVTLKPGERTATRDDLAAAVAELKSLIAAR